MEKQNYTREGLIHLCKTQPEAAADLILLLLDRVDKLEARVIELENALNKNSQNSHKPPSSDGYRRNIQTGTPKDKKRPTGGQSGHPGTTLRKSIPVDHIVNHPADTCLGCGSSLEHVPVQEVRTRQVFDLPKVKMEVTEHRSEVKQCPCCQMQTVGIFPPEVTKAIQYGSTLKSIVLYMMQHQLVPFERTTEFLQDLFGCTISEGTLKNWTAEAYNRLRQAEAQIKEQLQQAPILHVDETGIFCENKLHWIHSASTERYTHYGIHSKRGKEAMDEIGILLQSHKGFIDVESEIGTGTTFRMYLPTSKTVEPIKEIVVHEQTLEEMPGGNETVLIVEDEEMLMMSLQMVLVEKGYNVLTAGDGFTALKIFKEDKNNIALVLTDFGLPNITGLEVCRKIKEMNPNERIILATGYLDPDMKTKFIEEGIEHFLYKPYDLRQVLKEVREVLDKK